MKQFRTRFEMTYSVILAQDEFLSDLTEYDYP